jgi:membrane associated rhomboid family serine protease
VALLPIHDRNPRLNIRLHYVTLGLLATNIAVFIHELGLPDYLLGELFLGFGFVPALLLGGEHLTPDIAQVSPLFSLVTYQFLHGDGWHILFNMIYLWVFGDNIEDSMGHWRFLAFYLICGGVAALCHGIAAPYSTTPMIGASGAVAGVLGAYFILHPHVKIWTLLFWFIPLRVPALFLLGLFFAQNLFFATFQDAGGSAVAFWAHVGGFVAGMLLIAPMRFGHVKLWHRPPRPWKKPRNR